MKTDSHPGRPCTSTTIDSTQCGWENATIICSSRRVVMTLTSAKQAGGSELCRSTRYALACLHNLREGSTRNRRLSNAGIHVSEHERLLARQPRRRQEKGLRRHNSRHILRNAAATRCATRNICAPSSSSKSPRDGACRRDTISAWPGLIG